MKLCEFFSLAFEILSRIFEALEPIFTIISGVFSGFSEVFDLIAAHRDCMSAIKFRKQNHIKYVPFPGGLLFMLCRPNYAFLQYALVDKHGPVFGTRYLGRHLIIVSVPEIAEIVLSKECDSFTSFKNPILNSFLSSTVDDDEQWKRMQSIVTPFSNEKFEPWIDDTIETMLKNFEESLKNSPNINVMELYGAFTMDITMQVAFGTKVESSLVNKNRDRKKLFLKAIRKKKKELKNVKITEMANMNILELLLEAKTKAEEENEKLLTEAKSEEGNNENDKNKKVKFISNNELIEQCIHYFMTAYEATTSTISLATYFLALNNEMQDRLYQEIETTLEKLKTKNSLDQEMNDPTKLITPESLSQFEYLNALINETLRMYPPADVERRASKAMTLETEDGQTVFDVKKDDIIVFPVFAMHHDPVQFPEHDHFDPERFLHEQTFHKYAYLPFGSGPNKCVDHSLTLLQAKLALINVVHRYKLSTCKKTKIPIEFTIKYNNRPLLTPKEVILKIEKRF